MTGEFTISKSKFILRVLEYFREVERSGRALILTEHGSPVLKIVPYRMEPSDGLDELRGTVVRYDAPIDPVSADEWAPSG